VSGQLSRVRLHPGQIRRFGQPTQLPNCRIQVHSSIVCAGGKHKIELALETLKAPQSQPFGATV
jgi:hypothetical protein